MVPIFNVISQLVLEISNNMYFETFDVIRHFFFFQTFLLPTMADRADVRGRRKYKKFNTLRKKITFSSFFKDFF